MGIFPEILAIEFMNTSFLHHKNHHFHGKSLRGRTPHFLKDRSWWLLWGGFDGWSIGWSCSTHPGYCQRAILWGYTLRHSLKKNVQTCISLHFIALHLILYIYLNILYIVHTYHSMIFYTWLVWLVMYSIIFYTYSIRILYIFYTYSIHSNIYIYVCNVCM